VTKKELLDKVESQKMTYIPSVQGAPSNIDWYNKGVYAVWEMLQKDFPDE